VAFAPGRVNLIGEHTDYNDGLALPFAVDEGVTVTATEIGGDEVEAIAHDLGEGDRFSLDRPPAPSSSGWRAYARGVVAELQAAGYGLRPARLEISGTIPAGSGLSSSAALEVALCLALLALAGIPEPERLALARLCSLVESRWAGVNSGLLDQMASLFGEPDRALRIDFRSLECRPVAMGLGDWKLVAVDSGEVHDLAESGYNERRTECDRARALLGRASLRDATLAELGELPVPLDRRVRHVIEENARVEAAVAALAGGDLAGVGRLLDASHASLRDLYATSTDRVEEVVAGLKDAGAAGARMVGGGFGGHVLALFGPGAPVPPASRPVAASNGARLLEVP
jgi:galactokinase